MFDNLAAAHRGCNQAKKAKPLDVARMNMDPAADELLIRLSAIPIGAWPLFRADQLAEPPIRKATLFG